ncbi:MAG: hypothetical protein Q9N68_06155 [Gammaproteobacteria bacterium]|nr:hypothetical protein [Gammaproteobacteria bacterium]
MMHKMGAILYLLWGLLHIKAAIATYQLGATLDPSLIQGRVYQDAWNLVFFAVSVSVIAVLLNWRNSRLGFWLNLSIASVTDVGFILHVLMPGYIPMIPGIIGPILWVFAVIFTAIAIRKTKITENI